jgi:hypothetical protein
VRNKNLVTFLAKTFLNPTLNFISQAPEHRKRIILTAVE